MSIGFAPLLLIYCSPFASVYGNAMVPISFLYRTHTNEKPCTCVHGLLYGRGYRCYLITTTLRAGWLPIFTRYAPEAGTSKYKGEYSSCLVANIQPVTS